MVLKILVTGGAGGLGSAAIEHILQKKEEKVEIHAVDKDKKALDKLDERAEKHLIDIENYKKMKELSQELDIDILVNCAGYQMQGAAEDLEMEKFEKHISTNYLATVNCIKSFLPQLKEKENAKIINISSIAGKTGFPFLSGYSASKYALEGFTDSLRKELLREDIQVVLVEPGRVKTGFNERGVKNMENYLPESNWSQKYRQLLTQNSFGGISEEKAGEKLGKIITKNYNKPRYTINKEAPLIKVLKLVAPTSIYDRITNNLV